MIERSARLAMLLLAVALLAAACEKTKSANPLSPDVAGPLPGVDITAPNALEPASGATLTVSAERTTLVIQNPTTTGVRPLWMQLQLAADGGFQQVLHQAERVELGADGRTRYTLPEPLGAGHTYYWRVRATDGANSGPISAVATFTVADPVVLEAPAALEPAGLLTTRRPVFRAKKGPVSGPAGDIVMRFEIGRTPDLAVPDAVVTAAPGADGVAAIDIGELPAGVTGYWRAQATDGTAASPYSAVQTFQTPAAEETPAPGPEPAPTPEPSPGVVGGPRTISPDEALAIIKTVHDAEGWNLGSSSTREQRIQFFFRALAVLHYGHPRYNPAGPDTNWCGKDAGGGRPKSDDVMVRCNTREAWDTIVGVGANGYRFALSPIGRLPGEQNVYPPPRSYLPQ